MQPPPRWGLALVVSVGEVDACLETAFIDGYHFHILSHGFTPLDTYRRFGDSIQFAFVMRGFTASMQKIDEDCI